MIPSRKKIWAGSGDRRIAVQILTRDSTLEEGMSTDQLKIIQHLIVKENPSEYIYVKVVFAKINSRRKTIVNKKRSIINTHMK